MFVISLLGVAKEKKTKGRGMEADRKRTLTFLKKKSLKVKVLECVHPLPPNCLCRKIQWVAKNKLSKL